MVVGVGRLACWLVGWFMELGGGEVVGRWRKKGLVRLGTYIYIGCNKTGGGWLRGLGRLVGWFMGWLVSVFSKKRDLGIGRETGETGYE